jgi:hypothetical protein
MIRIDTEKLNLGDNRQLKGKVLITLKWAYKTKLAAYGNI